MVMHISRALSGGGRALGTMLSVSALSVPMLWALLLIAGPDQGWAFDAEFDVCSTSGESIPDGPNGVLEDIIAVAAESTVADTGRPRKLAPLSYRSKREPAKLETGS